MLTTDFSQELDVAKRLARLAGEKILSHYVGAIEVKYKGPGTSDPVTAADSAANDIITAGIAQVFPHDAILAEESPPPANRQECRRLWCIDPLDGTREFIDKNGEFAVMIGLAIDGEARLGVIYQPTEDALFYGAGSSAFKEQKGAITALKVSQISLCSDATLMVSRSHPSKTIGKIADALGIKKQLRSGSVGLKAIHVAQRHADLYVSLSDKTQEWDACAPEAILRAAGGQMTDYLGDPLRYNKPVVNTPRGLLATNGKLHASIVAAVNQAAKDREYAAMIQ